MTVASLLTLLTMWGGTEAQAQSLEFDMVGATVQATADINDIDAFAEYLLLTGALDGPVSGGPGSIVDRLQAGEIDIYPTLQTTGFDIDQICAAPVLEYDAGLILYAPAMDQCTQLLDPEVSVFAVSILFVDGISNGI